MVKNQDSDGTIRPLDVGNVVTTGLVLYRSHLKSYLGIAAIGVLWTFLPFVAIGVAAPLVALVAGLLGTEQLGAVGGILILGLFIAWFWLLFYAIAKYYLHAGLISRLAFLDLTSQPSTVQAARDHLQPLLWKFFRVSLSVSLRLSLIFIGFYFAAAIATVFVFLSLGAVIGISPGSLDASNPNPGLIAIVAIVGIVLTLCILGFLIYGLLWFFSRWVIAEVPLAIEGEMYAEESISRSWQLTQGSVGRVIAVSSIGFLITLPLLSIANLLPSILQILTEPGTALYWVIYSIGLVMGFLSNIFVLPFWQTMKAVLYADLRSRREGMGLRLRER